MAKTAQTSAKAPVSLLLIDDDAGSLELLCGALAQPGLEILSSTNPREGLAIFAARRPQVVITDLTMPEMSGMEVLERIMAEDPMTDVIVMTGRDSTESAVEAIRKGACDYLSKPLALNTLRETVGRLAEAARKRDTPAAPADGGRISPALKSIVGESAPMRRMFSLMRSVAPHYRTLLITGETGTGKELVARSLHELSPVGSSGRYVALNCSAVVETLFESELFGHVKGSFTGAIGDKPGLVEHAHGGTLFLDEIGDMPLGTQAKLLRVLQNREVQRVGALTASAVDVRVIAATNRDLRAAVAEKRFREDLYYRLSMVEIETPRLADRKEDLPLLAKHFTGRFAAQFGKEVGGLTRRAQVRLAQYSWPGNVRELENAIGHAVMMAGSDTIDTEDLPASLRMAQAHGAAASADGSFEESERELILRTLQAAGGNESKTARILRIGRDALRYKVRKYNLRAREAAKVASAG